ncbi:MAG: hypothetical protein HYY25_03200 [Candidatus Wallbacteria bacterium]|nr:hypothetical protein [Candidatus Wallbacteria bacterium]
MTDPKEALRKLRARKESQHVVEERAKNPLLQILKAILAFLGPIMAVYWGNYYLARNSADQFGREVFAAVNEGRIVDIYKHLTDEAFQANETLDQFVNRARSTESSLGKMRSMNRSLFEVPLIGGVALLEYDATFEKGPATIKYVLSRQGISGWRVAAMVVNTRR